MLKTVASRLRRGVRAGVRRISGPFSRRDTERKASSDLARPNSPERWEGEYLRPVLPVTDAAHPVAKYVLEVTAPGDLLLEAGCGSGEISACLALNGRQVALIDFSEPILERAKAVFQLSNLPSPATHLCDLTRPLPLPDQAVDTVWSSGVLEHWTDEELLPIVREMRRIARKAVISLVPFAGCMWYRYAKAMAEASGKWPYGRELPRHSLRQVFESAGLTRIRERIVWPEAAPNCLALCDSQLYTLVSQWWSALPADDPVKQDQGYLLLTVAEVPSND